MLLKIMEILQFYHFGTTDLIVLALLFLIKEISTLSNSSSWLLVTPRNHDWRHTELIKVHCNHAFQIGILL